MGEFLAMAGHHVGGILVAAFVTGAHDVVHHLRGDHDRKITSMIRDRFRRDRTKR